MDLKNTAYYFAVFRKLLRSYTEYQMKELKDYDLTPNEIVALGYEVLEDRLSIDAYKRFCKKTQKFMPYVSILSPNHSDNMLTITKKINVKKAQLIKDNQAAVDAGDVMVIDKISKELLDYARELMKGDPAMDMFNSGAGGSFENNFKNMFIMRGSVQDPDPRKSYNIITSNYIDGVSKEEYSKLANTLAAGPYSRSKKTELGGYWVTKVA